MNGLLPTASIYKVAEKKANRIHMRFMGRIYKESEAGGAYLVGYKIYFGNPNGKPEYVNEMDSQWKAFTTVEAGKAWLSKQAREITGKRTSPKWYGKSDDSFHQTDVLFRLNRADAQKYKWVGDLYA